MTRGRVLQKFLPELIRKVSGEGVEGGLAMWLAESLRRAKRQRSSGRVNYRGSGRLWRMQASMLPIFSFMLGASNVSLFRIMLPLHEVTMFLINRLPGATALLIHTYTNTEVPMLLMFLFGYLAQTSSFLFLLFPLPHFISPFSSCLFFLSSTFLSLSYVSFYIQT